MNIAFIEDHTFVGQTLQLHLQERFAEVKHFPGGESFRDQAEQPDGWLPDVIITDLLLQGISGVELIRMYKDLGSRVGKEFQVIVLSSINEPATIRQLIKNGAQGYLSKEAALEEVITAIEMVSSGKMYIMDRLKDSVLASVIQHDKVNFYLSPQQQAILAEICKGKTIVETATTLSLSVNTARTYLQNIMRKFGVNRTPDLILFAIKNGLHQV
jgi:DNA-binding NarL/FixJ family response regulator